MQPTYLPWAGYFNLIASVDTFVFLDDVQYDRRSWQSRNRIFDGGRVGWLTCPVKKACRDTLIRDMEIVEDSGWQKLHEKKIQHSYAKAEFHNDVSLITDALLEIESNKLSRVNQCLIKSLSSSMGIDTRFICASEVSADGKRSSHLLNICRALEADIYLSPEGSRQYLEEDDAFATSGVEILFQEYTPAPYLQKHSDEFVSHLSMVDVIANIGISASGRYVSGLN